MNILIIDNSAVFHKMLGDICSNHGMTPTFCETAMQALETIECKSFDFICIAMHLEDSNGIELARQIRDTPSHHYIPIILFTSDNAENIHKKALSAGITEVFLKQDIDPLLHFIQRFTQQQQPLSGQVLYVEDSLPQQQLTTAILTSHGLNVDTFDNAEEAWQAYLTYDYDVVVTDIILSGYMSGLELTNRIRRVEGAKGDIPILAMTSFDDISRRIELFLYGGE
ncbi:MAG: response regulator [Gammaproteobacteria bacterium]|nr:response regulator [Gammaproteobacteria bacterium]